MSETILNQSGVVIIGNNDGHTVIPENSPIKRLRYFDGKFLRAPDMELEQRGLLNYTRFSNQAGGAGVVNGLSCKLSTGDALNISAGLAIDAIGNLLYISQQITINIQELISKSNNSSNNITTSSDFFNAGTGFEDCAEQSNGAEPGEIITGYNLYIITAEYTTAFCGQDDVYGKLCEEACISSTERPYAIDGVLIRAIPLKLSALLSNSNKINLTQTHLRSRVASAFYEQEQDNPGSLISKEGLMSDLWCLGAEALAGAGVPLAVLAQAGSKTVFLDNWIARRERIDVPAKQYWAGRMSMRSWQIFLAQVLQFQCQLRSVFSGVDVIDHNPCETERKIVQQTFNAYEQLAKEYESIANRIVEKGVISNPGNMNKWQSVGSLKAKIQNIDSHKLPDKMLISGGIVELPSAGYLPVNATSNLTVNEQIRRMMGSGVDLRFCVVRPDFVPHAFEEAQHMERISLLKGLDNPANKPRVDVLVPNGRIETYKEEVLGTAYEMYLAAGDVTSFSREFVVPLSYGNVKKSKVSSSFASFSRVFVPAFFNIAKNTSTNRIQGAARDEHSDNGVYSFYFAAQFSKKDRASVGSIRDKLKQKTGFADITRKSAEVSFASTDNLFEKMVNALDGGKILEVPAPNTHDPELSLWSMLRFDKDPFKLKRGESTHFRAEVDVALIIFIPRIGLASVLVEIETSGYIYVDDIYQTGQLTTFKCQINNNVQIETTATSATGTESNRNNYRFSGQVFFKQEAAFTDSYSTQFEIPNIYEVPGYGRIGIRFNRKWINPDETQLTVSLLTTKVSKYPDLTLKTREPGTTSSFAKGDPVTNSVLTVKTIFHGKQKVNPDVLKPGHELHGISLTALRSIGSIMADRNFADINAKLLFPPPKPVPDELKVFATDDWVLFHRRRDINCGYDKLPEAIIKPRQYRVFHINVDTNKEIGVLIDALTTNNGPAITAFNPKAVAMVEFEAGIHTLRTSAESVRSDWNMNVNIDADIALGIIASRGVAYDEGVILAEARLDKLTDVLAPINELDINAKLSTLAFIPDVLAYGGVDGIILLATVSVDAICHEVYQLEMETKQISALLVLLQDPNSDYQAVLADVQAQKLRIKPKFRSGTSNFYGETTASDFLGEWRSLGNKVPNLAITILPIDAAGSFPTDQPYKEQTQVLANTAQGNNVNVELIGKQVSFPTCPAVTVLITSPPVVFKQVQVFASKIQGTESTIIGYRLTFENFVTSTGIWEGISIQDGQDIMSLGEVAFDENNTPDLNLLNIVDNNLKISGILGPSAANNVYTIYSISKKSSTANEIVQNRQQAKDIKNGLSIPGTSINIVELTNGSDRWDNNGTSVVYIFSGEIVSFGYIAMTNMYTTTSTDAPNNVVTEVATNFKFDESGAIIKDLAFETAIAKLKESGTKLKNIELVMFKDADASIADVNVKSLFLALEDEGVTTPKAKAGTRVATTQEVGKILFKGGGVSSGLILKK